MENWDWASDVNTILSENLSKDIDKEIEEYLDSFVVEYDGKLDTKRLPPDPKPSFSIRAERWLAPLIGIGSKCMHAWTYHFANYICSLAFADNKYQSYHNPPLNEFVISKNLENKFDEWRKKNEQKTGKKI